VAEVSRRWRKLLGWITLAELIRLVVVTIRRMEESKWYLTKISESLSNCTICLPVTT
jgi:hypothetical protein